MDIHIDPHLIATVAGFLFIAVLCTFWARFFMRFDTFLGLLGITITIIVIVRGDLVLSKMEGVGILGAFLTGVLVLGFMLIRYSLRRHRMMRHALRWGGPRALQFAEEPVMRCQGRLQEWPEAWPLEQSDTLPMPYEEEREVEYHRPAQRHSAQSRTRSVARPHAARQSSRARGARLQGGR
ncbi:MAG TPA: hypothetical protein VF458_19305 [Ktedonobacteraceae bacterium]